MSDRETLSVYAAKASDYVSITQGVAEGDPLLQRFLSELPAKSRILDLGCGPGTYAKVMAERGFVVIATDAVPEMIAIADTFPGVDAQLRTFEDLDQEEANTYDAIWANFSLLHAAREEMPRHLRELHRALRPGGLFHIALKSGSGEKRDSLGRRYAYFEMSELENLLKEAGFSVQHRASGEDRGLDGSMAHWIALQAHA